MQTMITNLKGLAGAASAQQTGIDCTSMARFNGMILGAGQGGLCKVLCGQTDAGVNIDAYFVLASTDLGLQCDKRSRYLYLGYETTGSLDLTLTTDSGLSKTIRIVPKRTGQQRRRITIGRGTTAEPFVWRWLTVKIASVSGSAFSIDSIQVLPIIKSGGVL